MSEKKPPCSLCEKALIKYTELKNRLLGYMFENKELSISYNEGIQSYTEVYNLIDKDSVGKLKNQKIYQIYELTFSNIFKRDLEEFSERVRHILAESKGMTNPQNQLGFYYKWITKYTRFLFWSRITFAVIQKNHKVYSKSSLYHDGLLIFKEKVIVPLYDNIFKLLVANLQAYKEDKLQQYYELQFLIRFVGMCGFAKYKNIVLEKNEQDQFQFNSVNRDNNKKSQVEYETRFFKENFTSNMSIFLKQKYKTISEQMIKLSTSEYVQQATDILARQQKAADYFYPHPDVKCNIIRHIEQIIIMEKSEQLITKQKTGLYTLYDMDDAQSLKALYKLLKRTSQQKLYAKYFQSYIDKKISEILGRLTLEEQKQAKKQVVKQIMTQLFDFYTKVDTITNYIHTGLKDSQDLLLYESLTLGFQTACNKNNTVCNFLVYYADNILKKQDNAVNNTAELVVKISKMIKFLHSLDAFLNLYQRMLGVRILYDQYKNRNAELEIISLLKNQAGVGMSSINKINYMIQDFKFTEQFNALNMSHFKSKLTFTLQVMILTSGSWQIPDNKNNQNLVPPELKTAVELYEEKYLQSYPGRQITWIFNFGRAITLVKFDDDAKYILYLNNYQLLILLYFQRTGFSPVQVGDLIQNIRPEDQTGFRASIMMFVKKGIIKKEGGPKIENKHQVLSFNKGFKSKIPKVGCFQVPRFTEKVSNASNQVAQERAIVIQANIVKIMKAKSVLHYNQIVPQVIKMCKNFKADIPSIKNQIETLIHKQFLERDDKDLNTLKYIS